MSSRILVFGAGALGTFYGGRLAEAGHDVTLVARGDTLAEIRALGLRWREGRRLHQVAVGVVEVVPPEDFDWALVLVRAQHLEAVLPLLSDVRCANVVVMVNNAGDLGAYREHLGDRALLGFAGAAGQRGADGLWVCQVVPGWVQPTTVGELDGPPSQRVHQLVELLEGAGFPSTPFVDMRSWLRYHAAWIAPLGMLGRGGPASELARALHEADEVLRAHGHPVSPPGLRWVLRTPRWVLTLGVATARLIAPVRRDLAAALAAGGGETELLVAQMVDLADELGLAAPTWRGWAR